MNYKKYVSRVISYDFLASVWLYKPELEGKDCQKKSFIPS